MPPLPAGKDEVHREETREDVSARPALSSEGGDDQAKGAGVTLDVYHDVKAAELRSV